MGFNPAYWFAIAIAFLVGLMSVTDPDWKIVCQWGVAVFAVLFVFDLLRRVLDLELQSPLRRREEAMAVRIREHPDGTREYRIRVRAQAFIYSQVESEEMNGCLIKGAVKLESK